MFFTFQLSFSFSPLFVPTICFTNYGNLFESPIIRKSSINLNEVVKTNSCA